MGKLGEFVLRKIRNFSFPFIISATVAHIQLKFGIWIRLRNMQVKFEVGHGPMIFDRSWKKNQKFFVSVHYLCNGCKHSTQIWYMDTPQFMHLKNFQFHSYEFPSLDFTVGGGIRVAPTHLVCIVSCTFNRYIEDIQCFVVG